MVGQTLKCSEVKEMHDFSRLCQRGKQWAVSSIVAIGKYTL